MSKSNTLENQVVALIFNGTALPWANANLFVALHTADPGEAGTQPTSEAAYTGYARVAIARGAGFTVAGDTVSNAATVQFAECTAGSATITHFTVGTAASGAGSVLYRGTMAATRNISAGITPVWNAGTLSGSVD